MIAMLRMARAGMGVGAAKKAAILAQSWSIALIYLNLADSRRLIRSGCFPWGGHGVHAGRVRARCARYTPGATPVLIDLTPTPRPTGEVSVERDRAVTQFRNG